MERSDLEFRIKNKHTGEWEYFPLIYSESWACDIVCCDEKTLGRNTGLLDFNREKSYEGDVYCAPGDTTEYIMLWNKETAGFFLWCPQIELAKEARFVSSCTRIGNIHDNPEFLEGK